MWSLKKYFVLAVTVKQFSPTEKLLCYQFENIKFLIWKYSSTIDFCDKNSCFHPLLLNVYHFLSMILRCTMRSFSFVPIFKHAFTRRIMWLFFSFTIITLKTTVDLVAVVKKRNRCCDEQVFWEAEHHINY